MTHEVHGIVEQPQNLDRFPAFVIADPEQDEMAPFAPFARHMQHEHPLRNVVT